MIMFLYRFLNYLCCKLYRKQYLGSVGHLLTQIHVNWVANQLINHKTIGMISCNL